MAFTDHASRLIVGLFAPRVPWKDQAFDTLPPPGGAGTVLLDHKLQWSPDSTKLAGIFNGVVTIYDTVSRQYRSVAGEPPGHGGHDLDNPDGVRRPAAGIVHAAAGPDVEQHAAEHTVSGCVP